MPLPVLAGAVARVGNLANVIWAADAAIGAVESRMKSALPSFEHLIEVTVAGGPEANMKRLWELAVATVLGRYRAAVKGPTGIEMTGVWDYSNKVVGVRIRYENVGVLSYLLEQSGVNKQSFLTYMMKGPREETIGGQWTDFNASKFNIKGIEVNAAIQNGGAAEVAMGGLIGAAGLAANPSIGAEDLTRNPPALPDTNRLITTRAKGDDRIQPPAPTVAGSYMLRLVANNLSTPCYLPAAPPILRTSGHTGGGSYFNQGVYTTDQTLVAGPIRSTTDVNERIGIPVPAVNPGETTGPDAYQLGNPPAYPPGQNLNP